MAIRILFAAWSGLAGSLLLTERHRLLYSLLDPLPGLAVAALTGVLNLSWYEIAYVLGTGSKQPLVFVALPWLGASTALLPVLLLRSPRWFRLAAQLHAATGLIFGGLALALLCWRSLRGFEDGWRMVATLTFVASHAGYCSYFFRRRSPAAAARLEFQLR